MCIIGIVAKREKRQAVEMLPQWSILARVVFAAQSELLIACVLSDYRSTDQQPASALVEPRRKGQAAGEDKRDLYVGYGGATSVDDGETVKRVWFVRSVRPSTAGRFKQYMCTRRRATMTTRTGERLSAM